jgi:ribosome-binding protein aMBF1 (putative translation factor)
MKKAKAKFKNLSEVYQEYIKRGRNRELAVEVEKTKLEVSEKLVEMREQMGLTQADLARKMGVSQQLISRVESGDDNITLETLVRFLSILGIALKIEVEERKKHQQVLQFV